VIDLDKLIEEKQKNIERIKKHMIQYSDPQSFLNIGSQFRSYYFELLKAENELDILQGILRDSKNL
jgi:hypothetical protein